jgi:hypothetical protein
MLGTQAAVIAPEATGPEWLQYVGAFAPLSTLVAAVIAGWIAWRTLSQRREADRRDQWWQRTQWAIGLAMDPDFSRAVVGLVALKHLAGSDLCTEEDYEMLDKIGGAKIDALTLSEESAERHPPRGQAEPAPSAHAGLIAVDLDSRSGRVFASSPEVAKALVEADRLVSFAASRHGGR